MTIAVAGASTSISAMRVAITDDDSVSMRFTQTELTVNEDDPEEVDVCVEMTGDIEREVSVSVTSETTSASDGDFHAVSEELTFVPGANRSHCFGVHVPADMVVEATETFSLLLSSQDEAVRISQGVSTIHIIDDDEVSVGFKQTTIRASEESQFVPVCVEFSGRTQDDIEVMLQSQPISARGNFEIYAKCIDNL